MPPFARLLTALSAVIAVAGPAKAQPPTAQGAPAAVRMNQPGPEQLALAKRTGAWDVIVTFRPTPDAAPVVSRAVAERVMIGPFLQETLTPSEASDPPFTRIDYLGYDRVEGRWEYLSLDTRLPVGLMPAWSFDAGTPERIDMQFEPLAFVGFSDEVTGQMMRSDMSIIRLGPDQEVKEQRFIFADGRGRPFTATRYEYTRRK